MSAYLYVVLANYAEVQRLNRWRITSISVAVGQMGVIYTRKLSENIVRDEKNEYIFSYKTIIVHTLSSVADRDE